MIKFLTAVSALLIGVFGADWQRNGGSSGKLIIKSGADSTAQVPLFTGAAPDSQTPPSEGVSIAIGARSYERLVLGHGAYAAFPGLRGAGQHAAQRSGYPPSVV